MTLNPRVYCMDGFNLSIQRTDYTYSDLHHIWGQNCDGICFEIGFPSNPEELIMKFAESPENPTKTVYAYVPLSVVMQVLEKHGGIREGKLPYYPGVTRDKGYKSSEFLQGYSND